MNPARKGKKLTSILLFLLFLVISVFALFPLFAIVLGSLKPSTEILRFGLNLKLQPELLSLNNYSFLFTGDTDYFIWYKNSIVITIISTLSCLLLTSMVGYGLAVYNFKGKNVIFGLVLIVMMIPV